MMLKLDEMNLQEAVRDGFLDRDDAVIVAYTYWGGRSHGLLQCEVITTPYLFLGPEAFWSLRADYETARAEILFMTLWPHDGCCGPFWQAKMCRVGIGIYEVQSVEVGDPAIGSVVLEKPRPVPTIGSRWKIERLGPSSLADAYRWTPVRESIAGGGSHCS